MKESKEVRVSIHLECTFTEPPVVAKSSIVLDVKPVSNLGVHTCTIPC